MNEWIKKSFDLDKTAYLDKLYKVYPMLDNERREIDENLKKDIKSAYDKKKNIELFNLLLKLKKFPIKDSYKAYFSNYPALNRHAAIERNPKTIARICDRLYKLGWEKVLEGMEAPIETNRQIGPMFRKWIKNQYESYKDINDFIKSKDNICILSSII